MALVGLLLPVLSALSGCHVAGSAADREVKAAVEAYLDAHTHPDWRLGRSATPDWERARRFWSPRSRASQSLVQFNKEQSEWIRSKPGFITKYVIESARSEGDRASAAVLLDFGQGTGEGPNPNYS